MPTPYFRRGGPPHTYFVQDQRNKEEMKRLDLQDQMINTGMGGVLPEQPDPTRFKHVLDIGCGTGGWLLETARRYPQMSSFVGVDINERMLAYARARCETEQLNERVQFRQMDVLRPLSFPENSFDLVNQRLADSYLRVWDWRNLLMEYYRVVRPGGVIRITESDSFECTSPALMQIVALFTQAFYRAGHLFFPEKNGSGSKLALLLHQCAGVIQVQTQEYALEHQAGTEQGQRFIEDTTATLQVIVPFLQKWIVLPDNYEQMCLETLQEIARPDFVGIWHLVTAWGMKP
jgi:ubiquinone/menaquinone biosynthesis C-methylase UbiE